MAALVAFSPSASIMAPASTTQTAVTVLGSGHYMRIVNAGPGNIVVGFYEPGTIPPSINFGNAMLILAGAIEMFSVASDSTLVALLGDPSGANVSFSRGEGQ